MTWHCQSCNRNFIRDPISKRIPEAGDDEQLMLFCPYCNSEKIVKLS